MNTICSFLHILLVYLAIEFKKNNPNTTHILPEQDQ
jgi:hypothetical protein